MIHPFDASANAYRNAARFRVEVHSVGTCEPVELFMYMTKKALFELRSLQESDYTSEALYLVWRLRSTVLTSLLPFGHPEINLDTKAKVVAAALNGFP